MFISHAQTHLAAESFGDGFIDGSLYELDEELKKADELLSNAQLLKSFEEAFDRVWDVPAPLWGSIFG